MASPDLTQREKRSTYIEAWYQTEKSLRRIGGIVLIFTAALIAVFDQPGDTWTAASITGAIAAGITLLAMRPSPRQLRTTLSFLKSDQQQSRSTYLGIGAVILLTQFYTRPLALILAGLLLAIAVYFQWRVTKINGFKDLCASTTQGEHQP